MCCQWILLLKHKSKIEAEFKEEFQRAKLLPEASGAIKESGLCVAPPEGAAVVSSVLYLVPPWFFCPSDLSWAEKWSLLCLQLMEVNQLNLLKEKNPVQAFPAIRQCRDVQRAHSGHKLSIPPIPTGALAAGAHSPIIPLLLALDFGSQTGCGNAVTPCRRWPQSLAVLTLPVCSLPNPGVYIRWSWTLWKAAQQSCY